MPEKMKSFKAKVLMDVGIIFLLADHHCPVVIHLQFDISQLNDSFLGAMKELFFVSFPAPEPHVPRFESRMITGQVFRKISLFPGAPPTLYKAANQFFSILSVSRRFSC
jgi:hypothetical protein